MFFLFQIWKQYTITTTNPWSQWLGQERKYICISISLETKLFKTVLAKFRRKFNLTIISRNQISHWLHKFLASELVNNVNEKAENYISGRKLTARCPYNEDAVKDSVGSSPKKSLRKRSQKLSLSPALLNKVNQFLLFSSDLTFLKSYDWLGCKMSWGGVLVV